MEISWAQDDWGGGGGWGSNTGIFNWPVEKNKKIQT